MVLPKKLEDRDKFIKQKVCPVKVKSYLPDMQTLRNQADYENETIVGHTINGTNFFDSNSLILLS
ncbi:Uncharacterized protein dnm_021360 [Desulfonema magnum]|uniref:Uncharacterized protein n=1 Tax=Desulfonema magnum TaxID=45655 RepID=A0A975BIU2_9BACT|nr:Uncharacterized protein dnm_021360 [Desulfonema magnum]